MESDDGAGTPPGEIFADVLARRLARRTFLKGTAALMPLVMAGPAMFAPPRSVAAQTGPTFAPIRPSTRDEVIVPASHVADVLIRWGDPVLAGAPEFDAGKQTPEAQAAQFGFNCDFVGYFPLDDAPGGEPRALLCVNHEYTNGPDMFARYRPGAEKTQADIEIAAHGGTIVEIARGGDGSWRYLRDSKFNRRITGETEIMITGPAAGHALMKTSADPDGKTVRGMLNNCSGGKTPWGTWLTCEENFNPYFANLGRVRDPAVRALNEGFGFAGGASAHRWEAFHARFDLAREPNEAARFGWVVEIDPYDPAFVPRKRTALGRFKHEAANVALAKSGQAAVYSGDDQAFCFVYKFVSARAFDPDDREANFDLLDAGTLYAAKFHDDGSGEWLALTRDDPALADAFADEGELRIHTRRAAEILGATAMDRPEDVEPSPVSGKVYVALTKNKARKSVSRDAGSAAANPRVPNPNGHILEITEAGGDAAATRFSWDVFILCGNPERDLLTGARSIVPGLAADTTYFAGFADAGALGRIAAPDNMVFDRAGNLWVATDGQPAAVAIGAPNDAIHVVPTAGPERGYLRQFLSGPRACEICGPEFDADGRTLFCAIQHPGQGGGVPNRVSGWPGGGALARPSVIAVRHRKGASVGES